MMADDCGFSVKEITIPSRTLVCRNPNCKAEKLHDEIIIVPLVVEKEGTRAGQPITVLILCKKCKNKQELGYSDYLKMVGLEARA